MMGDRIYTSIKCECGFEDDEVYYAPTCGFFTWTCPKCGNIVDLEKHTGVQAETMATTEAGLNYVIKMKSKGKKNEKQKIDNRLQDKDRQKEYV